MPPPQEGSAKQLPNPQSEAGYASVRHNNRSGPSSGLVLNVLNPSHRHIVRIFSGDSKRGFFVVYFCSLLISALEITNPICSTKSSRTILKVRRHLREHGAIQLFPFPYPPVSLKRYIFHCLPKTSNELY